VELRKRHPVMGWFALAVWLAVMTSTSAQAVADGTPLSVVARQSVFGSSIGVGNTLMEHDGRVNFAVRLEGSQATIPLSQMPPDAAVVQAFLFWGGTFNPGQGIGLDRDLDLRLPDGRLINNLRVDALQPGEPAAMLSSSRCVQRNHPVGGTTVPMFSCRREVTSLLQALGAGGAVGTFEVSDVNLSPGDCTLEPNTCEAKFGGWALAVMWQSPTEPVKRDLVLADAFFALDEQGAQFGGFSSGLSPEFTIDGLTVGEDEAGEVTILAWEGDAQLGVPPQNLAGNPFRCTDGRCFDFVAIRSNSSATLVRLQDATNRAGNLMNGSNNKSGGSHPGLDIDTFDVGRTGQGIIRTGDTRLFLQAGSGDGTPDDGSGGSGELFLLGFTLVSVETFAPRFLNGGTEKVVLEPVAGPGEVLNYILRLENDGSAPATNTIVRDQLPAGVSYVAGSTTNTCGVASADVGGTSPVLAAAGLNVGTLPIGRRCEVRFRARVDATVAEGQVLENFFTVQADGVPPLRVGPATTIIENAELARPTKTVSVQGGGEPAPGATLSYRIRIENTGTRPAPDVSVTDTLPPELEAVAVVAAPTGATDASTGNVVDVRGFTIAAGTAAEVVVTARIRAGTATGTAIVNQAEVDQPSLDEPLLTDDPSVSNSVADPTVIRVTAGIDLSTSTKTATDVNGGRLVPGDTIEFRIRVDKRGPAATVVDIADDLPANVENCAVVAPLPAGGFLSCQPGGANGTGRVTGAIAFSGAGTGTFIVRVTVRADAPDGATIANTAVLTPLADPSLLVRVSSSPLVVFARPDLRIAKAVVDDNGGDVRGGDLLRYSLTVTNPGTVPATNVVITDDVAANLNVTSVLDGGSQSGSALRWTIPSLAVGATVTLRFEARVRGGLDDGTVIDNVARGTADAPQAPVQSNVVSVVVRARPVLTVQKTVSDQNGAPFRPGDVVTWTITVQNSGDGAATDVVVTDVLDQSADTAILTSGGRVQGGSVIFDRGTVAALTRLDAGQTVTLRFDARLDDVLDNGTVVANQAQVTTPRAAGTIFLSDDPATATPLDPTRFTVTSRARLVVTKVDADDNGGALLPGETVTWTLAVENVGDAPATDVVVTDALDSRLTFLSADNGGAFSGGVVRFPAFNLLPGPPRTLRFTTRVASPLPNATTIDNQARATSPAADAVVSDDPDTATPLDPTRIVITSRPVLDTSTKAVVDVDGDGVFRPGDRVRYTIVVENTGSEDAAGVIVTDVVPAEIVALSAAGGTVAGQTVTFAVGALPVSARRTLVIEGSLRRPLDHNLVVANQAIIAAAGLTPVPTDDPTTVAVDDPTRFTVTSQPRLVLEKTVIDDNGGVVEPGDLLRWSIGVRNVGDRTAAGVSVRDPIDVNLQDVVALDGGAVAGGVITWSVPALAIDTTAVLRFTARVRAPLANGTVIANQGSATVADPGVPGQPFVSDDPTTATPLDPTRVQVVSAADLSTSTLETFDTGGAVIERARPGAEVEYRLVANNRGRANGEDIVVTLPFPAGVVVVDAAGGTVAGTTVTLALGSVVVGAPVERRLRVRLPTPLDPGTTFSVQARLAGRDIATPFVTDDPSTAVVGDPTLLVIDSAPRLTIDKTVVDDDAASDGGAIEPGDTTTWRLAITNSGDAIARNVVVTDPLPALVEHVSGGRLTGTTLTFDAALDPRLGSLVPGAAPVVLTFVTRVRGTAVLDDVVANQASSVVGAETFVSNDPATAEPLDPTRFTVTPLPRLTVQKDIIGGRVFAPGDVVTYTIRLRSEGSGPAAGAFVDVVDTAFATVQPGPGLVFDAATRELRTTLPPLPPGSEQTLTFSATLGEQLVNGTVVDNQARVVDGPRLVLSDDPTTVDVDDPTRLAVDARPVLIATKSFVDENGGALVPGDRLQWVITVENTGTGLARDVQLTDVIDPATVEVVDAGDGTAVADVVLFDQTTVPALAGLARGGRVVLSFVVRVRDTVVDGTVLSNQARVTSPDIAAPIVTDDPATAAPADPTTVSVRAPVLVVTKATDAAAFAPGANATYVIRVENRGGVAATDVVIRDVVPAALTAPTTTVGAIADGVLTATVPDLAPGASVDVSLAGVIDPLAAGGTVVSNQAEVRAREIGLAIVSDDPSTATPDDPTTRLIDADEDYAGELVLEDGDSGIAIPAGAFVSPGQRIRARVTVRSEGRQAGRGVVLTSPFSPSHFIVDETTAGGLIGGGGEARWTASQLPDLATFAPGSVVNIEFEGRVASPIADGSEIPFLMNVASVGEPAPTTIGPVTVRVRSRPDLSATTKEVRDVDGGLVEPGDVLDWRITVLNDGGTQADDVSLVDAIPAGMRYLPGTLTVSGQPVADVDLARGLPLDDVGAGRSVVVGFSTRVELSAPRGAVLSNQAILRAANAPEARSDDPRTPLVVGDPTSVVVGGGAFLVASLAGAPSPTRAATPTTLEAAIENPGTEAALDVELTLPIPAGTAPVSGSLRVDGAVRTEAADGDDAELVDGVVRLRRARLEAGDGVRVAVAVTANDDVDAIVAQGTVRSAPLELATDADAASPGAQPLIIPVAGRVAVLFDDDTLQLVDDNGGVLLAGERVTLRAPLKNRGTVDALVRELALTLSSGLRVDAEALAALDDALEVVGETVRVRDGVALRIEAAGQRDLIVPCVVGDDLERGEVVSASGRATAALVDGDLRGDVDLGSDSLTVGLLPGTGAVSGRVFVDAGARNGRFDAEDGDVVVDGFEVVAFWRNQPEAVMSVVTDSEGRFSLSPLPAGTTRLVVRSPAGAFFGELDLGRLDDGEVRSRDVAVEPNGSVWVTDSDRSARGLKVRLFVDDGDANPDNDRPVDASALREGQQDQTVSARGFYRFDPPPGAYRLAVIADSPLLVFPSSKAPVLADGRDPSGQQVGPGDVGDVVVVDPATPPPWAARFRIDGAGTITRNHLPVDPLSEQVTITKTATRKRASIGEIVSYEVRVDNKALVDRRRDEGAGVEIVDTLPAGFQLVDGSFQLAEIRLDGAGQQRRRIVPDVRATGGRTVRFGPFDLLAERAYVLRYNVVIGPGTGVGRHENTAALRLADGAIPLTAVASAAVDVVPDDTFDLGTVRAKVFCDDDGDGWQDAGERGAWGARVYLDNGTWAEADVTGKLHFSGVQPGMHLAKLDERTLVGAVASSTRQSFYMSAGLPAQVAFPVRCQATVDVPANEIVVNADAYRPEADENRTVRIAGTVSPLRLSVDEVPLAVPDAALELAPTGGEPVQPGPNLAGASAGLELRPRVAANADVVAWQIVIDDLGAPVLEAAASGPSAVDVGTFERSLEGDVAARGRVAPVKTSWSTAPPRPVWVMAGRGAPPTAIPWTGLDDASSAPVLVDGHLYAATLTIGLADGERVQTARVPFGVAVGARGAEVGTTMLVVVDESDGPLFSTAGVATKRLRAALAPHLDALKGAARVEVRAHLDRRPEEPVAKLTAARAEAARQVLIAAGLPADRVVAVGRGDEEPLFPNLRARDRARNRRVEVLLPAGRREVPPLPPIASPLSTPTLRVAGAPVAIDADGTIDARVAVRRGAALVLDVEGDGRRVRLVRGEAIAGATRSALAPVPVTIDVGAGTLAVDGVAVAAAGLLGLRIAPDLGVPEVRLIVPEGVRPRRTVVQVFADDPTWPDVLGDDAVMAVPVAEVAVDGAPPTIPLATPLAASAAVRVRVRVEDDVGNVGIAPDWRGVVGAPVAATAATAGAQETALPDPADGEALREATRTALEALARSLPAGARVLLEAHTDDEGPRMLRMGRSQRVADLARDVLVAAGVAADRVDAIGRGSDAPVVPNTSKKNRTRNRRLVVTVTSPASPPTTTTETPTTARTPAKPAAELRVNGDVVSLHEGRFDGAVAPLQNGELSFALRAASGARATVVVRKQGVAPWQGTPTAFAAAFSAPASPSTPTTVEPTTTSAPVADGSVPDGSVADGSVADVSVADVSVADHAPWTGEGEAPAWWPRRTRVPAAGLVVELPPEGQIASRAMPVRGRAAPGSVVTVNGELVSVDPLTGRFETRAKLAEGPGQIVVEAKDSLGNVARLRRDVRVDTSGWFVLLLADTAVGQDGALLDERSATTSLTLGPAFLYGRGVAYVKGRFTGPTLFRDYDLTLHLDTRRFDDDVFFRDVLDPDRFMPAWGDSSFEVQEARSGIPLFLELKADTSTLSVGSVRTDIVGGDLLRYQRARTGAQLTFDRGWLDPIDVGQRKADVVDPAKDPFRTRATTFVAGGGGERHARVELMGTGGSVYFLRHERLVEGSERVAVIVRDGVTGAEIARSFKQRNVDYTIRYDEGRVLMKEPVQAFADGAFITNHNLGQVASGHRVFVEVEYEHRDDRRLQGLAGGADVSQKMFGLVDLGGSYVVEGREDGGLAYQVGGLRARIAKDEGTFLKAELLMSQSVDAGNFVSFDGGLTYGALGQSLDTKATRVGSTIYQAERAGAGFKIDGQWRFGDVVGRGADDGVARAYYQSLQPGFFGGGGGIVEQGQTKWGGEVAYRVTPIDELRLRYDGVLADINPFEPVVAPRTLHRQLGTGRYARTLVPGLRVAGEVGYGYTGDSGSFGAPVDDGDPARATDFHTVITAAGVDWQVFEPLTLGLKQEVIVLGDPNQLRAWNDHLVTHAIARYALTDELSVDGGASVRWSGENQVHAGVGYRLNETSRVYVSERVGMLPAPGTGTMGFSNTTVVGGETELAKGSTAYAEYQLQSAFSSEQTRGVVGLKNRWALPFGLALSLNYERITTIGAAAAALTQSGAVAPAAFTDATFYAAPGQNGGGSYLYGDGSRDAASAGIEWRREDLFLISQRLELRYDNFAEDRGGHDTAWVLSMTSMALKLSPELSLLSRYNLALAQDLALSQRVAYLEEGSVGAAFRPITHDWLSVLTKLSRRVDIRPLGLDGSSVDDTAIHAFSLEPIVELPWGVQLVEKLALKHMSVALDDVPQADALTALWINRVNLRTLTMLRRLGVDPGVPGELDLGVEYRVLSGLSYAGLEHGALVELQVAPLEQLRIGVGYNFTRFSDNETERSGLEGGAIDRSGFFVRAVGAW
jgi:uncharacterized repeat protein (TIGR01451 family)